MLLGTTVKHIKGDFTNTSYKWTIILEYDVSKQGIARSARVVVALGCPGWPRLVASGQVCWSQVGQVSQTIATS